MLSAIDPGPETLTGGKRRFTANSWVSFKDVCQRLFYVACKEHNLQNTNLFCVTRVQCPETSCPRMHPYIITNEGV